MGSGVNRVPACLAIGAVVWLSPVAGAQGWTVDARAAAALAIADWGSDDAGGIDPVYVGRLGVRHEDLLDNGMKVILHIEGAIEQDAPGRPGFNARFGHCPPQLAACPVVQDLAGQLSPVSPSTGAAAGGVSPDEGPVGALELAYLLVDGPNGEFSIGRDRGVASRLDARPPRAMAAVSAFSPSLDPSGLVVARAENNPTAASMKLGYASPRFLGFRVGGSFTPNADTASLDFDPDREGQGVARAQLENVWEGAVNFSRRWRSSGVRVRAAVTLSRAETDGRFREFGDYEAWGAGVELDKGSWSAGLRALQTNNAWRDGGARYEAVEAGLAREGARWRFGVELAGARDGLAGVEGVSALVGARRRIGEQMRIGVAAMTSSLDSDRLPAPQLSQNLHKSGLLFELSVGDW